MSAFDPHSEDPPERYTLRVFHDLCAWGRLPTFLCSCSVFLQYLQFQRMEDGPKTLVDLRMNAHQDM
eukprot:5100474-Amphidinium_carterae.1